MMVLYDTGAATCVVYDDLVGLRLRAEEKAVTHGFRAFPPPESSLLGESSFSFLTLSPFYSIHDECADGG